MFHHINITEQNTLFTNLCYHIPFIDVQLKPIINITLLMCINKGLSGYCIYALTEDPIQINVILQQKLPAAKLSAACTVYKQ